MIAHACIRLSFLIINSDSDIYACVSGCVAKYFDNSESPAGNDEESHKKLLGYKCVQQSKASEEVMVCIYTPQCKKKLHRHSMIGRFCFRIWGMQLLNVSKK